MVVHHSRNWKQPSVQVRVIVDPAVDQGHADARANVIRLPRHFCVHRGRRIVERRQLPVRADIYDVRLVREVHDTGTVHQSDHAIDERQLPHDVQKIAYDAIQQAEQPTTTGLRSGLRSGRILHDHLYRLGGVISTQFRRNLGVIGVAECDRHQQTK